jgi:lysyl-tRNA synthetase class 2
MTRRGIPAGGTRRVGRLPLAPSDLGARAAARVRLEVGGRVLLASERELRLADAFATAVVVGLDPGRVKVGDLLVVSGVWNGTELVGARLVEHFPCPEPKASGDFARLSFRGVGPFLRARALALATLRAYFDAEGFLEVDPPARVRAPGVDLNVEALRAEEGWLVPSPELSLKRLLVGGVPRLYSLSHAFRRDEQGTLHEPEFLLLEWYRAFAGQEAVLVDTEALVLEVAKALTKKPHLHAPDGRKLDVRPPFPRVTVREAFKRFAEISDATDLAATDEDRYFRLLVDRVEPALARFDKPVFLCEYPLTQAALARPSPSDPRVAERFELYAGGVELCNGYGELVDPVEQRRRFVAERAERRAAGRRVYPLAARFIAALEEGMPPSGGNALGVDRLILLATGAKRISDVIPEPWQR